MHDGSGSAGAPGRRPDPDAPALVRSDVQARGPGQQLVTEALAHRRQLLQGVLRGWPARDVTALAQLLDRLAEAVQAQAPHTSQGGEP